MSFSELEDSTGIDRRKLVVIVISAVAAGAALVLMALMLFNKNSTPAQAAPPASGTAAGDAAQDPEVTFEPLTAPPQGTSWEVYEIQHPPTVPAVAVPVHPTFGPTTNVPSLVQGFDRSAEGALLAAGQLIFRADDSRTQGEASILDGPLKQATIAEGLNDDKSGPTGLRLRVMGFKFIGAPTSHQAVVDLLFAVGPQYEPMACTMDLRWSSGDWKVATQGTDTCVARQQAVSRQDQTGYVNWGPG